MSIFEYLIIAFSLLFTLTAMRLIGGLPAAIRKERRYGVHILFIITTLLGIIFIFWNYWALKDIVWTLPKFIFALLLPSLYYFIAVLLIPENSANIASWRKYYFDIRSKYFTTLAVWLVSANVSAKVLLDLPFWHSARIGHIVGLVFCVVGILVTRPKVHWALAILFLIQMLIMISVIGTNPEWLTI